MGKPLIQVALNNMAVITSSNSIRHATPNHNIGNNQNLALRLMLYLSCVRR
jgi:hypothetical protein